MRLDLSVFLVYLAQHSSSCGFQSPRSRRCFCRSAFFFIFSSHVSGTFAASGSVWSTQMPFLASQSFGRPSTPFGARPRGRLPGGPSVTETATAAAIETRPCAAIGTTGPAAASGAKVTGAAASHAAATCACAAAKCPSSAVTCASGTGSSGGGATSGSGAAISGSGAARFIGSMGSPATPATAAAASGGRAAPPTCRSLPASTSMLPMLQQWHLLVGRGRAEA
mmetsp:Transcript_17298/g.50197  ORF Transcript_17298/g.50197 Transcript_17298/m.50197 type:complete len:224 (+) Transcript_17298:202-873(+)